MSTHPCSDPTAPNRAANSNTHRRHILGRPLSIPFLDAPRTMHTLALACLALWPSLLRESRVSFHARSISQIRADVKDYPKDSHVLTKVSS